MKHDDIEYRRDLSTLPGTEGHLERNRIKYRVQSTMNSHEEFSSIARSRNCSRSNAGTSSYKTQKGVRNFWAEVPNPRIGLRMAWALK
jgi:hypothetical protein